MSEVLAGLVNTARAICEADLVTGAGGNVSAREGEVMWISPSGYSLADAEPEDYVAVDIASGEISRRGQRPSSEVLMHLGVYRVRSQVDAVLHTHPKTTVALTASGHCLAPMFADYYVYLGANVPHLPYITVTTSDLAEAVSAEFEDATCFGLVLRNHGAITVGTSPREALFRTLAVEEQATIQWRALQVGEPTFLSPEECAKLDRLGTEEYRRQLLARMKG